LGAARRRAQPRPAAGRRHRRVPGGRPGRGPRGADGARRHIRTRGRRRGVRAIPSVRRPRRQHRPDHRIRTGRRLTGDARAMDFDFTDEQQEFREAVRAFADEVVRPRAEEMDRTGEFPYDIVKQMGEMGLFGLPFPEDVGGQGSDFTTFCIAIEELARVDSSVAITLEAAVGLGASPINRYGTPEQKERWLGPMCRGEILGAFGLTEPGGGSDAGATRTTARLEGGEWVIN